MTGKQSIPHGLWPSPISPEMQAARLRMEDACFDSDGSLTWLESFSGKTTLMVKKGQDAARDISGGFKIAGGVGYGGGDYTVHAGLVVFASHGRLYRVNVESGLPQAITPEFGDYASPVISPDGSQVLFVHSYERTDCLAMVRTDGQNWPSKLASGADFYMQPTWHPDGQQIAWIEWNHPQMPWDGTRLMTARVNADGLAESQLIFGSNDIPVFQPEYSPDGRFLAFLASDGEWDTLYLINLAKGDKQALVTGSVLMDPACFKAPRCMACSADPTP